MLHLKNSLSNCSRVLLLSAALLTGCQNVVSPTLQGEGRKQPARPEGNIKPQQISQLGTGFEFEFNPKVDILFVIDNSQSMEDEQFRLAKNIKSFVDAIDQNPFIDYHIGVVTAYDRKNYELVHTEEKYDLLQPADLHYDVKGFLQPLLDPASFPTQAEIATMQFPYAKKLLEMDHPPYITKDIPNYKDVLAATLFVGVIPWKMGETRVGPIDEEVFSPVAEVLDPQNAMTAERNKGFRRPDAHFVTIMITDTDDADGEESSKISASQMNHLLAKFTGTSSTDLALGAQERNYSVYGVILPPDQNGEKACSGKDEFGKPFARNSYESEPTKIIELLQISRGLDTDSKPWLSLCDPNFGQSLASIGDEIRAKTSDVKLRLTQWPERAEDGSLALKVFYGDQEILPGPQGWEYEAKTNSIIVDANFFESFCNETEQVDEVECDLSTIHELVAQDAKFRVLYTPVDLLGAPKGHTQKIFTE